MTILNDAKTKIQFFRVHQRMDAHPDFIFDDVSTPLHFAYSEKSDGKNDAFTLYPLRCIFESFCVTFLYHKFLCYYLLF